MGPATATGNPRAADLSRQSPRPRGPPNWPPPLAWDDDTIGDPAARPHPWRRPRTHRSADLAADAADLAGRGYTRTQAAERLGVSRNTLDQAIRRAAASRERAA